VRKVRSGTGSGSLAGEQCLHSNQWQVEKMETTTMMNIMTDTTIMTSLKTQVSAAIVIVKMLLLMQIVILIT
jgi:hypothetical protein